MSIVVLFSKREWLEKYNFSSQRSHDKLNGVSIIFFSGDFFLLVSIVLARFSAVHSVSNGLKSQLFKLKKR